MNTKNSIKVTVFGQTGVGKSTLCNEILGETKFKSFKSWKPITTSPKQEQLRWTFEDTACIITLCDTPGFNDGTKQEQKLDNIKEQWKNSDVILYCIKSSLDSLPNDRAAILKIRGIKELAAKRMVIALTHSDKLVTDYQSLSGDQARSVYEPELQRISGRVIRELQDVFEDHTVPIVPTSKSPNYVVPGDKCQQPWLSHLFYEILDCVEGPQLYASLIQSHPQLKNDSVTKEDVERRDRLFINPPVTDTTAIYGPSRKAKLAIGGTAGSVTAGVVGAGVGATIGALAIGAPTFGVAAGAGVVLGGIVGGAIGAAVGTGGAVVAAKKTKN